MVSIVTRNPSTRREEKRKHSQEQRSARRTTARSPRTRHALVSAMDHPGTSTSAIQSNGSRAASGLLKEAYNPYATLLANIFLEVEYPNG